MIFQKLNQFITFQFQTGSIKSYSEVSGMGQVRNRFQFQTGSIKSGVGLNTRTAQLTFQFQTGSIKRTRKVFCPDEYVTFQFQTGSIKSPNAEKHLTS